MAKKHTEFHEKNLLPTVKLGGGSIMLWGCVASTGTGNLVKVEGHKNSTQYQQILDKNVQDLVTDLKLCQVWSFQQDNDPTRLGARSTPQDFLLPFFHYYFLLSHTLGHHKLITSTPN